MIAAQDAGRQIDLSRLDLHDDAVRETETWASVPEGERRRVAWHEASHCFAIETLSPESLVSSTLAANGARLALTKSYARPGADPKYPVPLQAWKVIRRIVGDLAPGPDGGDAFDQLLAEEAAGWLVRPCVVPRLLHRLDDLVVDFVMAGAPWIDRIAAALYEAAERGEPEVTGDQVQALLADCQLADEYGPRFDQYADLVESMRTTS